MQNYMEIDGNKIGVWTTECCDPPCVAVNMTVAIKRLEGYELTEEEKVNVTDLMAGYCSYVDQYGLTGYGDTEFEAIADLFSKAKKVQNVAISH
jgi:hypothetical protein